VCFRGIKKGETALGPSPAIFCGFTACGLRDFSAASGLYASEAALCQRRFSEERSQRLPAPRKWLAGQPAVTA
jgi:hypothetical protein